MSSAAKLANAALRLHKITLKQRGDVTYQVCDDHSHRLSRSSHARLGVAHGRSSMRLPAASHEAYTLQPLHDW